MNLTESEKAFREYLTRRKSAWIHFLEASRNELPKIQWGRVEIVLGEMKNFEHDFDLEQDLVRIRDEQSRSHTNPRENE